MVGSKTAEMRLELISKRLEFYGLSLGVDIICLTTDGDSVMKKIGKLSPTFQQQCLAHGLQLAIVDAIYRIPKPGSDQEENEASDNEESFTDESEDESENANVEVEKDTVSHVNFKKLKFHELVKKK